MFLNGAMNFKRIKRLIYTDGPKLQKLIKILYWDLLQKTTWELNFLDSLGLAGEKRKKTEHSRHWDSRMYLARAKLQENGQ